MIGAESINFSLNLVIHIAFYNEARVLVDSWYLGRDSFFYVLGIILFFNKFCILYL